MNLELSFKKKFEDVIIKQNIKDSLNSLVQTAKNIYI